jgi:hypothetical protein
MQTFRRNQVSPFVLSVALCAWSAIGIVAALAWYLANAHSKDGWSATPLMSMLALCSSPLMCVTLAIMLVQARRRCGEDLTALDWCGLLAGILAVIIGGLMSVGVWNMLFRYYVP